MSSHLVWASFMQAWAITMKPLLVLRRAWNTKTAALLICGNTASVPVWMTCVPTHDFQRCSKKSGSNHEREYRTSRARRDHVDRALRAQQSNEFLKSLVQKRSFHLVEES